MPFGARASTAAVEEPRDDGPAASRGAPKAWLMAVVAGGTGCLLALGLFLWLARGRAPVSTAAAQGPAAAPAGEGSNAAGDASAPPVPGGTADAPTLPVVPDTAQASSAAPVSTPGTADPPSTDLAATPPAASTSPGDTPDRANPPENPRSDSRSPTPGIPAPPATPVDDHSGSPARAPTATGPAVAPPPASLADLPETPLPAPAAGGRENAPRTDAEPSSPLPMAPPEFAADRPAGESSDRSEGGDSLADTLRKLGGLFEPEPPAVEPEKPAATPPPPAVADAAKAEEGSPRFSPPPPRNIDFAARLNDPIPEIEFPGTPLHEFLQFVANYSTIPISLDPDVLVWLNLTPASPLRVQLRDTTVAQLLDATLPKLGLQRQTVGQQLWITYASERPDGRRRVRLNLSDLAGDNEDGMRELMDHVTALVAPGSWGEGEGSGSLSREGPALVVEHTNDVLFQVITLCEKLRVARGLSPKSKFNPRYFQLATRHERAQPLLAKHLTLNYPRPTPLVRVLSRISQETGGLLLVDWRATVEEGWNPDTEVTFTAADQPLGDALKHLLDQLNLTYRIVDETTLQITTRETAERKLDLEFYRVADSGPAASHPSPPPALLALIPPDWVREGGGNGAVRFDAASRCLLVSLPPSRQIAVEKMLRETTKLAEGRR